MTDAVRWYHVLIFAGCILIALGGVSLWFWIDTGRTVLMPPALAILMLVAGPFWVWMGLIARRQHD